MDFILMALVQFWVTSCHLHTHNKFVTLWLNCIWTTGKFTNNVKGLSSILGRNRCYGLPPLMTALIFLTLFNFVKFECNFLYVQVYVLKRPHVDEFLQRMGELFECVLFTASLAKVRLHKCFSLHSINEEWCVLMYSERNLSSWSRSKLRKVLAEGCHLNVRPNCQNGA